MSNYDTDVFFPLVEGWLALSGVGPYTGLVIGQNGVTKDNEDGKKDIA